MRPYYKKTSCVLLSIMMIMSSNPNHVVNAASDDQKAILEERINTLDKNIDAINKEVDNLIDNLKVISSNVTSKELNSNSKLKKEVKTINNLLKTVNSTLNSLINKIKSIDKNIQKAIKLLPEKEQVQPEENNPNISTYDMAVRYDKTKSDKENLQMAIDSGCERIYLNKDLSLPEGSADSEYIWVNRPVYIYGNQKNKIDVAIRITADNVTLDNLYLTREVRPNKSFNNLVIKNCVVDGSKGMGIYLLNYTDGTVCKNITIENCTFKNNAWHGIAFKGTIPSNNKPSNGGNGVGYGIYENVTIKNCTAYNNGYVVQNDGSIKSTHEYSAGINIVDSCEMMKNCVVENCVSYGNYSNGFHMESVPIKENIKIINCKAYDNGKNSAGTHFGCGFSVISDGVTLENCKSENNTVANYTVLQNQEHSPFKKINCNMINCYDDGILVNWNDEIANSVYNGNNLIYNGDLKYGSMHFGFYYSNYICWFYNTPIFLRRNGYKTPYYEADVYTDKTGDNFIHGKFMTNIFKLDDNKKYKLTVVVDNSNNTNKDNLLVGMFKYNYTSNKDTKSNTRDKNFGDVVLIKNKDCKSGFTTYTVEINTDNIAQLHDGYYTLYFKNSYIDKKISLNNINKDALNIKIYDIKLEEIK